AAAEFLEEYPATKQRLQRVSRLFQGWETPYGLELLATVHWALTRVEPALVDRASVHEFVASWTPRKAKLFKPGQIDRAIERLIVCEFASEPGANQGVD